MSENNIFRKIIDRELPSHKIYEDEKFLVILDIFPKAPGHCLVLPKKSVRWVWDSENYSEYFSLVQKIALCLRKSFDVEMVRMEVYGEEVPHAHVHLWPQVQIDGSEQNFTEIAEKIKSCL